MREHELVAGALKRTLLEKVPEFQDSKALVNEFVIKKTIGGLLRFRPKTREELESDMEQLSEKYKRVLGNLRQAQQAVQNTAKSGRSSKSESDNEEVDDGGFESDEADAGDCSAPPPGLFCGAKRRRVFVVIDTEYALVLIKQTPVCVDPALQEEVDRLQVELTSKTITIHSQADEINALYAELDKLRVVQDQLERKKHKIALLEDKMSRQRLEVARLVHEKEVEAEKCVQLQEELQFLRGNHVDDVSSRDQERLEQFELIQNLRARELELQSEIEQRQRRRSSDHIAIHQQIRLLEKEAQLAEDGRKHAETERAAFQKKHDALERQKSNLEEQLDVAEAARLSQSSRVKDLEAVLVKHESMSKEQLDALTTATAEKLAAMQQQVDEKDTALKSVERQLNAAKLLVRQSKKEKEQAQDRLHKLQEELHSTQQSATST